MKFYLTLVASLLSISCHPDRYNTWFTIKNNSSRGICYSYFYSFPDTSIPIGGYLPPGEADPPSVTSPSSITYDLVKSASLENVFSVTPSGNFQLSIFDETVADIVTWDTVRANYLILKRYDLTLGSINKMDRIITYP